MSWNYRNGDQWNSITPKARQGEEWVTVSGGGGGGGAISGEWDWQDPPSRSSTEYTSNYSSIQDALNSISSDTELVIDDGSHTESFSIPQTNHITLSGGSGGATINNPGVGTQLIDNQGGWNLSTTSCSSISEGDTTLSVGNASQFSSGDDVRIHDSSDVYKDMTSSELRNTYGQYKGQFAVVESVNSGSNTITLTQGVHQDYPNPSGNLEVGVIDWCGVDFHLHNVTLDGGVSNPSDGAGSDMRGFQIDEWKNVWITDSTFQNWNKDGTSCGEILNYYHDNCHVENVNRYGYSHADGLSHARLRNCTGANLSRYLIQCGGGATNNQNVSAPTYDIMALNCHLDNSSHNGGQYLGDAHFAAERVEYIDCSSANANAMKIRGFDQHLVGGEYDCGGSTAVQTTQIVGQSSVEGIYCENGSRGWNIWPKEGHPINDITMEDCQFENMSVTPFRFRTDSNGNPANVNNLQVINSSWNGEWIDDQMIQNSDGTFDSSSIDYTTSYPSNQTPAEYFG